MSHVGTVVLLNRTAARGKAGRRRAAITAQLQELSLPDPASRDDLVVHLAHLHERPLDAAGPGWEAYVVRGLADQLTAYYLKTDRVGGDGVSAAEVLELVLDGTPDALRAPGNEVSSESRSELDPVARWVEAALADPVGVLLQVPRGLSRLAETPPVSALPGMSAAREVLDLVTGVLTGLVTEDPISAGGGLPTPSTRLDVVPTPNRRIALGTITGDDLRELEERSGLGTTDVAVLLLAKALRRWLLDRDALPSIPLVAAVPGRDPQATGNGSVHLVRRPLPTHLGTTRDRIDMLIAAAADPVSEPDLGSAGLAPGAVRRLAGAAGFNVLLQVVTPESRASWSAVEPTTVHALGPVDEVAGALAVTMTGGSKDWGLALVACREVVPDVARLMGYLEQAAAETLADLAADT